MICTPLIPERAFLEHSTGHVKYCAFAVGACSIMINSGGTVCNNENKTSDHDIITLHSSERILVNLL